MDKELERIKEETAQRKAKNNLRKEKLNEIRMDIQEKELDVDKYKLELKKTEILDEMDGYNQEEYEDEDKEDSDDKLLANTLLPMFMKGGNNVQSGNQRIARPPQDAIRNERSNARMSAEDRAAVEEEKRKRLGENF